MRYLRSGGLLAASCFLVCLANPCHAQVKTWTSSADFNEGTYFNTNSGAEPGALKLNRFGTAPVPFINIPVGGPLAAARGWPSSPGRIVRVNTETGRVVGEYRCTPESLPSAPSRAVVDRQGNIWVTNRYEGEGTFAVTKIGVILGGERFYSPAPGVFLPHPLGEYVKDPVYTTGVDRDNDGYIRTSAGLSNLLGWTATTGFDLDSSVPGDAPGTVRQADDELITLFKRHRSTGGRVRSIALDENDDIWIGFQDGQTGVLQLDGDDGRVKRTILGPLVGYTMLYQNGYLWGTSIDQGDVRPIRYRLSDGTNVPVTGDRNNYVANFAPLSNGDVVASTGTAPGRAMSELLVVDGTTAAIKQYIPIPGGGDLRGVIQDQDGDIWVASRGLWAAGPFAVYRVRLDGTLKATYVTGDRPCGIGLDSNGFVWVTHIGRPENAANGSWATVLDPRANNGQGAIVGYVGLGTGSYNYSDGTGATTSQISRDGEWRVTYDSFRPRAPWGRVDWDATVPAQTTLQVFIRAAETRLGLNAQPWRELTNAEDVDGAVAGRYLEVRTRLSRAQGTSESLSPTLRSVSVRYATGTITGQVGLTNWLSLNFPTADFRVRPAGAGGQDVMDVPLGPFGAFAFRTVRRGPNFVLAKASHWLRQSTPTVISITEAGAAGLAFALINGDVDGDNQVTVFDYDELSAAFDSSEGDANWNPNADLDGDGRVTVFDYDVLSANFDLAGAD